jgi:hypothetical protein
VFVALNSSSLIKQYISEKDNVRVLMLMMMHILYCFLFAVAVSASDQMIDQLVPYDIFLNVMNHVKL